MMVYFKNKAGVVFGYDNEDPNQADLIIDAAANNWIEVTDSWPPPPNMELLNALLAQMSPPPDV